MLTSIGRDVNAADPQSPGMVPLDLLATAVIVAALMPVIVRLAGSPTGFAPVTGLSLVAGFLFGLAVMLVGF
jgi:hypothetical protein